MDNFVFYLLSLALIYTSLRTITHRNPVYGALYLAFSMVLLAALYFIMEAYFIAGVQLIVYAGAVIVLFVMILMLFDLNIFKKHLDVSVLNSSVVLFLLGIFLGITALQNRFSPKMGVGENIFSIKKQAWILFEKYVISFELLGLLLLLVAIGAVMLTRLNEDN